MRGDVRLRYCKFKGEIRDVSDFIALSSEEKRSTTCPECDAPLILRLGSENTHHAAHKSFNKRCSLSEPEGQLHYNTKIYIAKQLKAGSKLFIKRNCKGWMPPARNVHVQPIERRCSLKKYHGHEWISGWDDVQIEKSIGTKRPDIVLYREGKAIAAIEIFVTHSVDAEKALAMQEMNIPWIEVKAEGEEVDENFVNWADGFDNDGLTWTIDKPLPYHNCFPGPGVWICDYCREAPKVYEENLARYEVEESIRKATEIAKEHEGERKRQLYYDKSNNKIMSAKALEIINHGETERFELFLVCRTNNEPPYKAEEIYLRCGRYGKTEILIHEEPITENSKGRLLDFYENVWLVRKSRWASKVVHITDWVSISDFEKILKDYDSSTTNKQSDSQLSLFD